MWGPTSIWCCIGCEIFSACSRSCSSTWSPMTTNLKSFCNCSNFHQWTCLSASGGIDVPSTSRPRSPSSSRIRPRGSPTSLYPACQSEDSLLGSRARCLEKGCCLITVTKGCICRRLGYQCPARENIRHLFWGKLLCSNIWGTDIFQSKTFGLGPRSWPWGSEHRRRWPWALPTQP